MSIVDMPIVVDTSTMDIPTPASPITDTPVAATSTEATSMADTLMPVAEDSAVMVALHAAVSVTMAVADMATDAGRK